MKWVIFSSWGILSSYGEFDTENDCEAKCKELSEINKHINVFYMPYQLKES